VCEGGDREQQRQQHALQVACSTISHNIHFQLKHSQRGVPDWVETTSGPDSVRHPHSYTGHMSVTKSHSQSLAVAQSQSHTVTPTHPAHPMPASHPHRVSHTVTHKVTQFSTQPVTYTHCPCHPPACLAHQPKPVPTSHSLVTSVTPTQTQPGHPHSQSSHKVTPHARGVAHPPAVCPPAKADTNQCWPGGVGVVRPSIIWAGGE
jgi:hypothetical protein